MFESCAELRPELQGRRRAGPASFNLSRIDFQRDDMVDQIEYLSKKYKVPRDMTNIEITESAFVEDTQQDSRCSESVPPAGISGVDG